MTAYVRARLQPCHEAPLKRCPTYDKTEDSYLRATPTMIGGVLYAPDAAGLIEAFDAATGQTIWRQDPGPEMASEVSASSTRGVDYWKGASDHRLFTVRNGYLYALDLRGRAV